MTRTQTREVAFKMVFGDQFLDKGFDQEEFVNLLDGEACEPDDMEFAQRLVVGVREHFDELRQIIENNLSEYKYDRLFFADKAALLLCTYELKFCGETVPPKVAINEAINLVKKYSDGKSPAFVNSVLDKIYKGICSSNE